MRVEHVLEWIQGDPTLHVMLGPPGGPTPRPGELPDLLAEDFRGVVDSTELPILWLPRMTRWESKQVLGWIEATRATNVELTMRIDDLKQQMDARDERVLDLEAEIAALAGLIKTLVKAGRPYFDEAFPSESLDGRGLALYNAWHRAMAEAMFAVDGRPDGLSRTFVGLDTLKDHYLAGVECDHDRKQDRASCACSRVDLGWQPSVGEAVDSWIAHVRSVEGGGEHDA